MIALKLILQSFAAVSAVFGLCVSSALLIPSKNKVNNTTVKDVNDNSNIDLGNEHYFLMISYTVANFQTTNAEYKCKTETNIEDESCGLFSLMFNETKKSIDFEELKAFVKGSGKETEFVKKTKTEEIKGQQFFILKTDLKFALSTKLDWTTKINLLNKESNQDIAKLTVYAKITEDEALGKVNTLVAKVTKVNIAKSSPRMQHMCKLNGSDKKIESYITPINNTTANQTYKDIDFSTLNEENRTAAKENDYFLINFNPNKSVEISSVKNATIVCDIENLSSPSEVKTVNTQILLSVEAPIFIIENQTIPNIQNQTNPSIVFLK